MEKQTIKNSIAPFLWLHGESAEEICEEMRQIRAAGIAAVCVESRTHEAFGEQAWFDEMDVVLEQAKEHNMKVWLLDDKLFPTGFANGLAMEKYPQYLKQFMRETHVDVLGPMKGASFYLDHVCGEEEELLAVAAFPLFCDGQPQNLHAFVRGKTLYWDVPKGRWRIFYIVKTRNGGEEATKNHINPLVKGATELLIEAVYQPHYERYGEEFGKTFAGFFSDEPRFGNCASYDAKIGRQKGVLPYCDGLLEALSEEWGESFVPYLPCLWHDCDKRAKSARYVYMDVVTRLYSENFNQVLGTWCEEHGVEYIGHVIEDDGAHCRLGYGAGHFFRALSGQHMSGIDIVLKQAVPGHDYIGARDLSYNVDGNGEFYHFTLAKLGSSLGHLDAKKKGRTMCEIFGAYGWSEGLKLMKWLADFMLVRGVNYFVPHAFSLKPFPDADCPPHFYAQGNNIQYPYYSVLMNYINRMANVFSDGTHIAPAAVLYHAEAEWYDDCMPVDSVARELMRAQIDFDILWADILEEKAELRNGKLCVNGESFSCLIVPECTALPKRMLQWLCEAVEKGFKIYFIHSLPQTTCCNTAWEEMKTVLSEKSFVLPLCELVAELRNRKLYDVITKDFCPYLRYYHYRKADADYYMFFNEHPHDTLQTTVMLQESRKPAARDVLNGESYCPNYSVVSKRCEIDMELAPYESVLYMFQNHSESLPHKIAAEGAEKWHPLWNISLADFQNPNHFTEYESTHELVPLNGKNGLEGFSGIIRYETEFDWEEETALLSLGEVFELCDVTVNGISAGTRICSPYRFLLDKQLKKGENKLRVEVRNTLVQHCRDVFSCAGVIEPVGLLGPVSISRVKQREENGEEKNL